VELFFRTEGKNTISFVRVRGPNANFGGRLQDGYLRDRNYPALLLSGVSIQKLQLFALIVMAQFPPYNTVLANCHKFAKDLYFAMRCHFDSQRLDATIIEEIEQTALAKEQHFMASLMPRSGKPPAPIGADRERPLDAPGFIQKLISYDPDAASSSDQDRFYRKREGLTLLLQREPHRAVHFFFFTHVQTASGEIVKIPRFFTISIQVSHKQPIITFEEVAHLPSSAKFEAACRLSGIALADIKTVAVVMLSRADNLGFFSRPNELLSDLYRALNRLFLLADLSPDEIKQLYAELQVIELPDPSYAFLPSILPPPSGSPAPRPHPLSPLPSSSGTPIKRTDSGSR
jgi:hypothetical protein